MSLKIRYVDEPEGAKENMSVSSNGASTFSEASLLVSGLSTPWATLEPGVWALDGSRTIMPDEPMAAWWSSVPSDADGRFADHPKLWFRFQYPYTSTGLTFTFSPITEQWCSEIKVTWYNGQNLLAEGTYYPDSPEWTLQQVVESFDLILVEIISTNKPNGFAKLQKFGLSREIFFERDEIIDVNVVNEVDPTLCELSADELSFTIRDNAGRNLIPQENQLVEVIKNGRVFASHYIKSSVRESGSVYKISAQSAIGRLTDTFLGGIYTDALVGSVLPDILQEWPFQIDEGLMGERISGYIPVCTQREALQHVAFAIGAIVTTQGGDRIYLSPIPTKTTKVFGNSDVFLGGKVETKPRISKVEVTAHSFLPSDETETLVYDEYIDGDDVLLTFSDPHHDYEISGGSIAAFGANWVKVTARGNVSVKGKKYSHNTIAYTKQNPLAQLRDRGNTIAVPDATLVNRDNAVKVLNRLFDTSTLTATLKQEAIISGHRAGDKVTSANPWGTQTRGFITSMESTLTQNGHTAKVEILGVEVVTESVHYYSGEIYAGDEGVL